MRFLGRKSAVLGERVSVLGKQVSFLGRRRDEQVKLQGKGKEAESYEV